MCVYIHTFRTFWYRLQSVLLVYKIILNEEAHHTLIVWYECTMERKYSVTEGKNIMTFVTMGDAAILATWETEADSGILSNIDRFCLIK